MLHAPSFDISQFSCLKPNLSCVRYWAEYDALVQKLAAIQREKTDLLSTPAARLGDVRKTLLERLGRPRNAQARQDRLRAISLDLASLPVLPGASDARKVALETEVASLYGLFDDKAFEDDWDVAVGGVDVSKRIKAAEGRLGPVQAKINKLKETLPTVFVGETIPRLWGTSAIPQLAPHEDVLEFGNTIVRNFVQTWRSRAELFHLPVTINGIAINTLATSTAATWLAAYGLLGFNELKKRPYYHPIVSNERVIENHQKSREGAGTNGDV